MRTRSPDVDDVRCYYMINFRYWSNNRQLEMNTNAVKKSHLDPVVDVLGLTSRDPLISFIEMWYQIFLWALFSSLLVHVIAVIISFGTLRKHNYGKFCPIFILCMGIFTPLTSGIVSSAIIAFVYRASMLPMAPLYAMFWGAGQTLLSAAVGFTRILATL